VENVLTVSHIQAPSEGLATGSDDASKPLVTAVMITGLHDARYALARVSIECFKNQTYPNKELLIVNHGNQSLFCDDERIVELRVKKRDQDTVGDLRNLGLRHASGDFIINWDDDDWFHPQRIEVQMNARQSGSAVLLLNRLHYSFQNNCAFYRNIPHGAAATILHPRTESFRYPSLIRGSDAKFAKNFRRILIDNDPALYIRFFHGLNLWDAKHIMGSLAAPGVQDKFEISPEHQRLLQEVLLLYRDWKPQLRLDSIPLP